MTVLEAELPPDLKPIWNWFVNTYVGHIGGERAPPKSSPPRFPYQVIKIKVYFWTHTQLIVLKL